MLKNNALLVASVALTAVLIAAGVCRRPAVQAAEMSASSEAEPLTFDKDIAPIVYQNCVSCHRAGEVAPFPLATYQDVQRRAPMIAAVTQSHYMPPWKAAEGAETFVGAHRLTGTQIAAFQKWSDEGAPEGRAADLPAMPHYASGWTLGPPDAVVQPDRAYTLAADGADVYRCFVIPTDYGAGKYLSAIEVKPGNPRVVHHVIAYLDTSGKARELAAADPGPNPGYTSFGGPGFPPSGAIGGWVPGNIPQRQPDGIGTPLPKGADIVLQVHYHKSGKPETDLTKVGLYFTQKPVDKVLRVFPMIYPLLNIPPGQPDYKVKTSFTVPEDVTVRQVLPHMHWLGHAMTVTAKTPGADAAPLIDVPDYDFNWQMTYTYKDPVELPKGTRLRLTADYDNSANNPRNPSNPPKRVGWGEQTTDEMCIAFFFYTIDSEHLTKGEVGDPVKALRFSDPKARAQMALDMFDTDEDGGLDAAELAPLIDFLRNRGVSAASGSARLNGSAASGSAPFSSLRFAHGLIAAFDKNGDGQLDADELADMQSMFQGGGNAKASKP